MAEESDINTVTKLGGRIHVCAMGVVIHPGRLRLEMARRGWSATDLAREAGLSRPTVSAATSGRAVAARSVGLMAAALARTPVLPAIDSLVLGDRDGLG